MTDTAVNMTNDIDLLLEEMLEEIEALTLARETKAFFVVEEIV